MGKLGTGGTVAYLASPTFTGTPAAPTANTGTNTTQIATTAFVQQELSAFALQTGQWIILRDQKASGTNGGTFTAGAWRTRVLNTEVSDPNNRCSLATNQFTLTAGNYGLLKAQAPGVNVGSHQVALYNVTTASYVLYGTSESSSSNSTQSSVIYLIGTLAVDTTFELRHRCEVSSANVGLGTPSNFGNIEVYAQVIIEDLN